MKYLDKHIKKYLEARNILKNVWTNKEILIFILISFFQFGKENIFQIISGILF